MVGYRSAPTPLWQALEANGTLKFCVPKLTVDVVAWEGFDIWVNNKYLSGATSANKVSEKEGEA